MLYNYKSNRTPEAGVRAFAFQPNFSMPLYNVSGVGFFTQRSLAVMQPPQAFQAQSVPDIGLGGTVQGQMALQPLLQTRNY